MKASPSELLVYGHTIDRLFNDIFKDRVTPELRESLRQAGLDLSRPILPAYPLAVVEDCLELTARALYAHLPLEAALKALGEAQVDAFLQTVVGRTTFALLKMLGIRRALERVTYTWRNANNFVQVEVRELSRDRLEVWINEVGRQPHTFLGIVYGAMRYLTGKPHQVTIAHQEGHSCTYLIELGKHSF